MEGDVCGYEKSVTNGCKGREREQKGKHFRANTLKVRPSKWKQSYTDVLVVAVLEFSLFYCCPPVLSLFFLEINISAHDS